LIRPDVNDQVTDNFFEPLASEAVRERSFRNYKRRGDKNNALQLS
jgi:hypothetical protein